MIPTSRTIAFSNFNENRTAVRRLLEIHRKVGGKGPGRRWDLDVLNRSAVVLLVACWEAYLEDVASYAFDNVVRTCKKPNKFPKEVVRRVGEAVRNSKDERMIWEIAGDGWRKVLTAHKLKAIDNFHNPNSTSVDDFFLRVLGLKDLSACWHWRRMSADGARKKLNRIVSVRGAISHRVQHSTPVHLSTVKSYLKHIIQLVRKTDSEISSFLKACGK